MSRVSWIAIIFHSILFLSDHCTSPHPRRNTHTGIRTV